MRVMKIGAVAMAICALALLAGSACGRGLDVGVSTTSTSSTGSVLGAQASTSMIPSTPTSPATTRAPDEPTPSSVRSSGSGTKIVITKGERRLDLYSDGIVVQSYRIALGSHPVGDKEQEGDGRTPEGDFYICFKNPKSQSHFSLGISYPNKEDAERGLQGGMITDDERDQIVAAIDAGKTPPPHTALGGEIAIHGGGSQGDWTTGCVALDESDIRKLYDAVQVGTTVVVRP